jgi:nucleoside-diphosphate kinase
VYETVLGQMTDGPVIAFVVEGIEAVSYVRKIVGTTDPKESLPGTIRGDYTHITKGYANPRKLPIPNIVHASGNEEEAAKEIALWFNKDEIYDNYENVHGPIVRGYLVKKGK